MTRSFLCIIFITTFIIFSSLSPLAYGQISEIASLVTSILGGTGGGAAIGNAAAGASNAIGNLGALYQLAQTAMQLTGTGVGIANQAAESQWFPVVVEQAAKNHKMMTERLAAFNNGQPVSPLIFGGTDGFGGSVTSNIRSTTESTLPSEYGSKIVITETTESPKTSNIKPDSTSVDKEDNVDEYEEEDKEKSGSEDKNGEEYSEEKSNRIDIESNENVDEFGEKIVKEEKSNGIDIKKVKTNTKSSMTEEGDDGDDGESDNTATLKKLMKVLKNSNLKEDEFNEIAKQLTKSSKKIKNVDKPIVKTTTLSTSPPTTTTEVDVDDYNVEGNSEEEERKRIIEETKRLLSRRTTVFRRVTTLTPKHPSLIKLLSTTPIPTSEKIFPIPMSQAIKSDNNVPGVQILTTTEKTRIHEKPHIILVKPESSVLTDPQGGVPIESTKKASRRIFTATIPIIHGSSNFASPNQVKSNVPVSNIISSNNRVNSNIPLQLSSSNLITNQQQQQFQQQFRNGDHFQQINNENVVTSGRQPVMNYGNTNNIRQTFRSDNNINKQQEGGRNNNNFVKFNGATTYNTNNHMALQTLANNNLNYQQQQNYNRQVMPYQNTVNNNNGGIGRISNTMTNQNNNNYNNYYQQRTTVMPYQQQNRYNNQWNGYNNYPQQQYYQQVQSNSIPKTHIHGYNQQYQQQNQWQGK
uniref:DUF148 domain-containing protein n=1 Tax=Parastrongyloides trichosuri TaxID=131310 RepID=A0A0N4Z5L8_PARTI